jgi:template-activating factor I
MLSACVQINDEASDKVLEVEQKYNEVRRPVHKKRNDIIKRIPEFWATTFSNHPSIGQVLTETDRHIFTFLTEVRPI